MCTCPHHLGSETHDSERPKRKASSSLDNSFDDNSLTPSIHSIDESQMRNEWSFTDLTTSEQPTNQQQTKSADTGNTRTCMGYLNSQFHQCQTGRINARSIKIQVENDERQADFFFCTPSVFVSYDERQYLSDKILEFVDADVNVHSSQLLQTGECTVKNCNSDKIRTDVRVKKPKTTSKRVNSEDSCLFCSIDHMLHWIRNLSQTYWDRNILVNDTSTTTNGK